VDIFGYNKGTFAAPCYVLELRFIHIPLFAVTNKKAGSNYKNIV
jgi:hypothetical protein